MRKFFMYSKVPFPPHHILGLCSLTMFSYYVLLLCSLTMSLYYALILYPCTISLCHILTPCPYVMSLCYDYIQCHCLFLSPPLFPYSLPSAPYVTEKKSHIIYSSLHSTHPSSLLMGGCVSGRGKEQPENEQTEAGRFGDFFRGATVT